MSVAAPITARLLPTEGRRSLAEHRSHYAQPQAPTGTPALKLIDEIRAAGLRGRGGARFPTAQKLHAVAGTRGSRIVVANGTEGEPASAKDRALLEREPHLVLDGAVLAATAVAAKRIIIAVSRSQTTALASLRQALAERLSAEGCAPIEVVETPPRYVAGEETALVRWLNGGPAKPTITPPRPAARGVDGRPTLVQNVETLAHLAQIATNGAAWFRQLGEPDEPGTMLVSVSQPGSAPRVFEIPVGMPVSDVVSRAGAELDELQALLIGGFFGSWLPIERAELAFSLSGLAEAGARPGAGVVIGLPLDTCGLSETARLLEWYAAESAGQCGPCLFGLAAIAGAARQLADGRLSAAGFARLSRWGEEIAGRGACHYPDGAVGLLKSALATFAADAERHLSRKPCAIGRDAFVVPRVETAWR